jgi:hypothetical protein
VRLIQGIQVVLTFKNQSWECSFSSRVLVQHVQGPGFNPQCCQKAKTVKQKWQSYYFTD